MSQKNQCRKPLEIEQSATKVLNKHVKLIVFISGPPLQNGTTGKKTRRLHFLL